MWPSLPAANHIADVANIFFIGSLVIGVVSTVLIVWMSGVKEAYWEKDRTESAERIAVVAAQGEKARAELGIAQADIAKAKAQAAALERDTAKARQAIVEANARTKEAELKLEELRRQVAPRILKRDALIKALEGQPKAPTEIMYLRDDAESFELAQQISLAMEAAGWQITSRLPIPPTSDPQAITAMAVGGQPSGVTVVVSGATQEEADASLNAMLGKEWAKTPFTVLEHALGDALGKITVHAGGQNVPPEGTLRVVVSPRI